MTTYHVEVVIGTQYLLQVEADNLQQVHDRVDHYDPTEKNHNHIVQLESETGRNTFSIEEFTPRVCPTCQETQTDCTATSVETGEIVQTFEQLRKHYSKINDETAEHLAIVLDAYLTHGVSPCNEHSRA